MLDKLSLAKNNISFEKKQSKSQPKAEKKLRVGYLVHENALQSVGSTIKGYSDRLKYTKDALRGQGNDYSVGKINDLTLKVGSVGIATVLASMTKNPAHKVMEFVGCASFIASMDIWPKVFIAAPIKLKTGVDINQEYIDCYNKRKRFFEDAQYLPWDLYSSKELNKIGDKLKIPKNIENREHHVKDKMQQISTQANTLWMLTAGFATPLMACLMGNYAGKYVNNVVVSARAKSAIKKTGLEDFTKVQDEGFFKKYFVNKFSDLLTFRTKSDGNKNAKEMLKNLDSAYDAVFGKSEDPQYECYKAKLLYDGVPMDETLTEYDVESGKVLVRDESGKIVKRIDTKNIDGISIFGDKWQKIPSQLSNALGLNPKEYKKLMRATLSTDAKGFNPQESELLAEMFIKEFGGKENSEKLKNALLEMEKILTPSVKEMDSAHGSFVKKLNEITEIYNKTLSNPKLSEEERAKVNAQKTFVLDAQWTRIYDKVANTKTSWFSPIKILDIIAQSSDLPSGEVVKSAELKGKLTKFIYGITPHHINNNFDDIEHCEDSAKYSAGVEEFFANLSDKTKSMFSNGSKLVENIDNNSKFVRDKLYSFSSCKNEHYQSICELIGKTTQSFIIDGAKQTGIYKGWLKKVGIGFAALVGLTEFAILNFGKTNKANPDVYRFKSDKARSVQK